MKILMVLENEFPFDERVEKEALSLIKSGHEVHLLCATLKNKPSYEDYNGIILHRVSSSVFYYKKARIACLTLPFYFQFWNKAVSNILSKEKFEAIHVHDLPLAKVGIKMSKKFSLKLIMDFHENYPYMLKEEEYTKGLQGRILSPIFFWEKYERRVLNNVDYVVCVCQEMKERMQKITFRPKFTILDNTVDISRWPSFIEKEKNNECWKTIYVGGFTAKRGIEVAIKGIALFNKLNKGEASLDLYGSGKQAYIDSLLDLAKKEGVADYVNFKGYINLPNDAQDLCKYDVGLIPHLKNTHTDNTSPNKIFQYYYYKLPVLCSDCNYLIRLVEETKGGLIYKNTSPDDFAEKLKIMSDANKRFNWGESAYKSIVSKYNWGKSAEALCGMYGSLK